jgi:hypothetical protein
MKKKTPPLNRLGKPQMLIREKKSIGAIQRCSELLVFGCCELTKEWNRKFMVQNILW